PGDLPERNRMPTVEVDRDPALAELRVHQREDVAGGAHGQDVAVADGDVEPAHGLPDHEGVDQEVEDRVRNEQAEVAPRVGGRQRAGHPLHGDTPEQKREDQQRARPGGGPLQCLQADGSASSNLRMSSSANRSRTYGVRSPSRFTFGTIFEKSILRNSFI